jgi:DNA-binding transcriptional LysR family regulator
VYDFTDLKLIRYIAEEPNLSAVAVRARMSLPAISQRLTRLEVELRTKLVHRSGGFGLTPQGHLFLVAADRISAEIQQLERELLAFNSEREALLRVACEESVTISDLPHVLRNLRSERPGLHVQVEVAGRNTLCQRLAEGKADLVLIPAGPMGGNAQSSIYKMESICLIAPLTHPLGEQMSPVSIQDVATFEFIGLSKNGEDACFIEETCRENDFHLKYSCRVPTIEAQCILAGQTLFGVALAFESTAHRHSRTQPVAVRRLTEPWAQINFIVATRSRSELSENSHRFIEILRAATQSKFSPKVT